MGVSCHGSVMPWKHHAMGACTHITVPLCTLPRVLMLLRCVRCSDRDGARDGAETGEIEVVFN